MPQRYAPRISISSSCSGKKHQFDLIGYYTEITEGGNPFSAARRSRPSVGSVKPTRPASKILAIDDDPLMRRLIAAFLEPRGYQVDVACGATEALHMLAEKLPDLICCDLIMPVMSGLDFVRHVWRTPEWSALPVIVVSAAGEDDLLHHALALGASGHLPKPFTRNQLLDAIESALQSVDGS